MNKAQTGTLRARVVENWLCMKLRFAEQIEICRHMHRMYHVTNLSTTDCGLFTWALLLLLHSMSHCLQR